MPLVTCFIYRLNKKRYKIYLTFLSVPEWSSQKYEERCGQAQYLLENNSNHLQEDEDLSDLHEQSNKVGDFHGKYVDIFL